MTISYYFLLFNLFIIIIALVNGIPKNNCNVTKTKLQICEGSDISYPSTYGQKLLKVKPILTFLNFAEFDPEEKTVTVFVSLMLEWNDTRLSLNK